MRKIFVLIIRAYQVATSNFAPRCKYYPSCSNYAVTAIGRYGVKGIAMTILRIARCNPWSHGGVDYVDEDLDSANAINSKKNEKEVAGAN
jgi:putative membrane protein insertion efficiency factor